MEDVPLSAVTRLNVAHPSVTLLDPLCSLTRVYVAGIHPKLKLTLSLNRAALAQGNEDDKWVFTPVNLRWDETKS